MVGVRGQLGFDCKEKFSPSFEAKSFNSYDLELTRPDDVSVSVFNFRPRAIINAAAFIVRTWQKTESSRWSVQLSGLELAFGTTIAVSC
ncbi:MAG: sugar nucleotide-binding protein [Deltaproteobacteria bacterium]|nr:sugar nucleotide-binding protein [Candidatus Tharpella sp.]